MSGYVYIGVDHSRLFKIGIAKDPDKRERQFKTGNPTYKIFMRFYVSDPKKVESDLHSKFANKRVTGEWFALSGKDIQYICEKYTDKEFDNDAAHLFDATVKGEKKHGLLGTVIEKITNKLFGVSYE